MIVLDKYKLLQKLMGLDPRGGFKNVILRFIYLIIFFLCFSLLSIYVILNIHDGVYRLWDIFIPFIAIVSQSASYFHLLIYRARYQSLLDDLQDIVNERTEKRGKEVIYLEAEQRISFATKLFIYYSTLPTISSSAPFILAAYHWVLGKYTVDSWIWFFPVWTPFELNTTARHLLMASYESVVVACCAYVLLTMPSLLIGFLIYLEAFYLDIRTLFAKIDRLSERKLTKPKDTCLRRRENLDSQMLERCKEAVSLHQKVNRYFVHDWIRPRKYVEHSDTTLHENVASICCTCIISQAPVITSHASGALECSRYSPFRPLFRTHFRLMHNLADVMNFIILMMVKPWAICECVSLLMMEKYSGTNFFYDLSMPIMGSIFPLILLALLFYVGQKFFSISTELNYIIYHTQWYQYPRSLQRCVLLMIMRSQQPFHISAYGIMQLSLENYVGLVKTIYSGFTVLRSVD